MKKQKLSSNFVDFKQAIIPAGDCFNEECFFAMSIEGISQRETSGFSQRATSAMSNKRILQRETSDFLQRATSTASDEQILQRATSDFTTSNEQRATSEKLRLTNYKENERKSKPLFQ